jgi:hypothetical protein
MKKIYILVVVAVFLATGCAVTSSRPDLMGSSPAHQAKKAEKQAKLAAFAQAWKNGRTETSKLSPPTTQAKQPEKNLPPAQQPVTTDDKSTEAGQVEFTVSYAPYKDQDLEMRVASLENRMDTIHPDIRELYLRFPAGKKSLEDTAKMEALQGKKIRAIYGSASMSGSTERNKKLSEERAIWTAIQLNKLGAVLDEETMIKARGPSDQYGYDQGKNQCVVIIYSDR